MVGSTHTITVSEEQYAKHGAVIEHWCDGGEVEGEVIGDTGNFQPTTPRWSIGNNFRIAQRKPQVGEVWHCSDTGDALLISSRYQFVNIADGTEHGDTYDGAAYAAPSVKAYYAREFLSCEPVEGSPADKATVTMHVLTEAAQESTQ